MFLRGGSRRKEGTKYENKTIAKKGEKTLPKYFHNASIGSFVCTGTTRLAPSDLRQSGVRNHVLPRNLLYGESNGEQQCLEDSTLLATL